MRLTDEEWAAIQRVFRDLAINYGEDVAGVLMRHGCFRDFGEEEDFAYFSRLLDGSQL